MFSRKWARLLFAGASLIAAQPLLAERGLSTSIDYIQTASNGNIFVAFGSGAMPNCYENRGGLIAKQTEEGAKSLYAMLLSAKLANKAVTPVFDVVGSNQGLWGRCQIRAVFLGLGSD